jgi:cation:H+ antiporter
VDAADAVALLTGRGLLIPLAAFLALGATVFAVASRLAAHADAIAEATGLGRLFVGTLVLAATTSLPELTTDVNAALLGSVDIGVGDLMGSTLANMLILAVADLTWRRHAVLDRVSPDHVLVGTLGIAVTALAGAAVASGGGWLRIGHVGVETIAIVLLYAFGMRAVYLARTPSPAYAPPDPSAPPSPDAELPAAGAPTGPTLKRAVVGFGLAAAALLATAPLLVVSAEAIAIESGAGQTLVGTLLVGFTTSFPELAATVAAIRLGANDLAVGNVFGSNAVNMCVLAAMDAAYLPGPVLSAASPEHAISAQFAVLAIGLGVLAVARRARGTGGGPRVESVLIIATYVAAVLMLARGG